ncbi:helix-turn-helix transcriptional regulator [Clostridium sp.]|uniref:helix-turn-helix transcriptional regulator n=1 Tax=Clostridium sp. TaxID=1506 RepID=UPI0026110EA0|nr:helix-turn-helix transcriptional regulator [Clostridium sp.]
MKRYEIISNNIKKLRNINKLTQKDLAKLLHKSEITIRKYESGDAYIPFNSLVDICRLFNITPMQIFTADDKYNVEMQNILDEYKDYLNSTSLLAHPSDYEFMTRVKHGYGDTTILLESLISHVAINNNIDINSLELTPMESKRIYRLVNAIIKEILIESRSNKNMKEKS